MKFFVTILFLVISFSLKAQYYSDDQDLNRSLVSIDASARLDFAAFRSDICLKYNVSEKKIDYLSAEIGMSAGDIFLTVELASISQRSVDQVVEIYRVHKAQGWGVMAKELGIKPGSSEFHALKASAKNKEIKGGQHHPGNGKGKSKN